MKFSCKYNELLTNLKDVSSVVEDALLSDDLKNIIFKFIKCEDRIRVKLIGINQLITFRRSLEDECYTAELDDSEFNDKNIFYIQLKSKELLAFLDSYKGLRKTHVEEVTFENLDAINIKCSILEKDNDTGVPYISSWVFNNIGIKPNMIGAIELAEPETELNCIPCANILVHTRNLVPIMQNGTNLYSNMQMDSSHVVAFNPAYTTIMTNMMNIGDVLSGLKLSYRGVSFMDKILCSDPYNDEEHVKFNELSGLDEPYDYVKIAKTATHIFFRTKNSEAFVLYDTKLANYETTAKMFVKDHAIVIDRIYLKDILKRLSLINDMIEFNIKCTDNCVELKNSKYSQDIPILQSKGLEEYQNIKFKIMPDVLNKAIIGDDAEFSDSTFVYFCPQPNGSAMIVFADDSGTWFSIVKVKTY